MALALRAMLGIVICRGALQGLLPVVLAGLLVESSQPISQRQKKSLQLVAKLQIRLGDRPIDVLVLDPAVQPQPVHEQARRTGIRL